MFKLVLEKAEEPEIKLPTPAGSSRKQENSRKTSISALLIMPKPLCRSQQTGKFFKRWEYQTTLLVFWEICVQVKKQQLELGIEQQTGSKQEKEYIKAVYCHPAYFNLYAEHIMRNAKLDEAQSWNQDCWEKYQ